MRKNLEKILILEKPYGLLNFTYFSIFWAKNIISWTSTLRSIHLIIQLHASILLRRLFKTAAILLKWYLAASVLNLEKILAKL